MAFFVAWVGVIRLPLCKILGAQAIKPHKVRYYLERRDLEFEAKMAQILCVCKKVEILKEAAAAPVEPNASNRLLR